MGEALARLRPKMKPDHIKELNLAGSRAICARPAFERSKRMASRSVRRAFTLIELLTVIAIIAVLAALLFPVFSRVNQNRMLAQCMSNMHDIYVAANLYYHDYNVYPELLFGAAERPDGMPWTPG